jgi:hypothetical protein
VNDRLAVWPVHRDCLRAWRRDFWLLTLLAGMVLLPIIALASVIMSFELVDPERSRTVTPTRP